MAGVLVLVMLAGFFRVAWLLFAAAILLGVMLQIILAYFTALAFGAQKQLLSGRRLFVSRLLLGMLVALAICTIAYFQYRMATRAFGHIP